MASKMKAARKRSVAARDRVLKGGSKAGPMTAAGHRFSVSTATGTGAKARGRLRGIQASQRRAGEKVTGKRKY